MLETGPHYSSTQTPRSAQLVIHDAAPQDSGTYTAIVTRRDGTQVRQECSEKVVQAGWERENKKDEIYMKGSSLEKKNSEYDRKW